MFIIKLAVKNLTRHKRRVLLTASIIALAIAIFLVYDAVQLGLNKLSFDNIRDLETGDLQVVDKDYWANREDLALDNLITPKQELMNLIQATDYFKAAAPQLKFSANLNNGLDELPVIAYGIKPRLHNQVFTTKDYLLQGSMLEEGSYEVLLAKKLANLMDFKVGDYSTLVFKTESESFNTIEAQITGLIHTNNPEVNSNFVYLPLGLAQEALQVDDQVSEIVIKLSEDGLARQVSSQLTQRLEQFFPQLEVHSWWDSAGEILAMSKVEEMEKLIMSGLILLIAAVGIINTIILSSLERRKEIGMMKALGVREREIILIFMLEAAGIGLIGAVIGSLLGAAVIAYLSLYGINLAALIGDLGDWGLPIMGKLYGVWNLSSFIFVINFAIIVSFLASILPAYWAARKDPVEAIAGRNH